MRIVNMENGKMIVEVEPGDLRNMEVRIIDYVRQVVCENVIRELTKQMLEDKGFLTAVKETIKQRVNNIQITDMVCFKEIIDKEGRENQ